MFLTFKVSNLSKFNDCKEVQLLNILFIYSTFDVFILMKFIDSNKLHP